MGKRGPTTQPTAILKQKGTYRDDRHEDQLSETGLTFTYGQLISAPDGLDDVASGYWDMVMREAVKIPGYVSTLDLPLLERLCSAYSRMKRLEVIADSEGAVTVSDKGRAFYNPSFKAFMDVEKRYIDLCAKFGLSPSDRTSVKLGQGGVNKQDEFEDFG